MLFSKLTLRANNKMLCRALCRRAKRINKKRKKKKKTKTKKQKKEKEESFSSGSLSRVKSLVDAGVLS